MGGGINIHAHGDISVHTYACTYVYNGMLAHMLIDIDIGTIYTHTHMHAHAHP